MRRRAGAAPPPPLLLVVLVNVLFILGGLVLLYLGAEALVKGAATLAIRLGLSPLVVGLTVVAFGTSAPELVVSVQATIEGSGGIAVGNVVGSNIANISLILGLAAIVRPLRVETQLVRLDIPLMIGASLLMTGLLLDRELVHWEGALLLAGVTAYVIFGIQLARRKRGTLPPELIEEVPHPSGSAGKDLLVVAIGLGLLVAGAHGLVRGAVAIAETLGVPETVIGLTIVAVGTSLPELATSVVAAMRGEGDIAIGNVVGSNLFNLLCILGVAALVRPLWAPGLNSVDLLVMVALAVLMLPLARTGHVLSRGEGALLFCVYLSYMVFLLVPTLT